jgi:citrate synthase
MVNSGLEGVTVAQTRLSDIDGENGTLAIAGFPVEELATSATYEETLFLLLEDRLPGRGELQSFRADLAERRGIAPQVRELLR